MKKRILISLIIIICCCTHNLFAQSDGFFTSSYFEYREENSAWEVDMPYLPGSHGHLGDYSCVEAPLGSGLLLLAGLGLAYAHKKRD